ncbi:MAG: DNA gyrase inhibitor YacG [Acidobacteriota bacterium]|nr:DNA gyrase inhibitor YacG [Acidobacteriota bacterium]
MAKKKTSALRCPTCRKIVLATEPAFPFCCERCRTIDLGKWISGGYVISSPVNDPESGGETEYARERRSSPQRAAMSEDDSDACKPN